MRLSLHCHHQWPQQQQLLIDLAKIFTSDQLTQLQAAVTAGACLLTARFNDRELAGALLILAGEQAQLSQLQVREITQRRGVGRFVVDEAAKIAADGGALSLQLVGVESAQAQAFAQACGFLAADHQQALTKRPIKPSSASNPP
jgi:GNAT superfamily N-acetyltransferase